MLDKGNKEEQYQLIWKKFLKGDVNALSIIYFDFFDMLLSYGLKYQSDRQTVEDCIQNLFVDLLKNRTRLKDVRNLKFYLIRGVQNQIMNEARKTKRLVHNSDESETNFRIEYSVETQMVENENAELVKRFVEMATNELTNRQKEALYLKFNCGFDYNQIADLMGVSIDSARTIIYRTLKALKGKLGETIPEGLIFIHFFRKLSRGLTF